MTQLFACGLEITITDSNIHIKDSYKLVDDYDKKCAIGSILNACPEILKYRSFKSMFNEWKAHNIMYQHNYEVERTKDVDIEFNQPLKHKIAFWLIAHIFKEKEEK